MSGDRTTRGPINPRPTSDRSLAYTICRSCGCTVNDACLVDGLPCGWATSYLCTRCEMAAEGVAT